MSNPLDDALMSKEALGFGKTLAGLGSSFSRGIKSPSMAKHMGSNFAEGAMLAAGAASVGAIGSGAAKLLGAVQKKRDFGEMLEVNPDLTDLQSENPRFFNASYTSLRNMNPTFAKDPIIAGGMMRRMMASPESAGGILASSIKSPDAPKSGVNYSQSLGPLSFRRDL